MTAILVLLTVLVALGIDAAILSRRRRLSPALPNPVQAIRLPQPPQGVFLDTCHTWLRINSDGRLRVGLDDLLAEALGEIDRVEIPARGTSIERGETLLKVTVKGRTLHLPSPASGEVMSANDRALKDPQSITKDPYGSGWIVSLWTRDHHGAIAPLRIGAAATSFLRQELQRLADFLTPAGATAQVPVMADGGLPARGAASVLADDEWKAFEEQFLSAPPRS